MNRQIKNKLYRASNLNFSRKYDESLELFDRLYESNPEEFRYKSRVDYAWAIYHVHIENSTDMDELLEYAEFITNMAPQSDLNRIDVCPYVLSVFKVLDILKKDQDYISMLYWLDKLDVNLLESEQCLDKSRPIRSKREKYYDYLSIAYLGCGNYRKCIETSKFALKTFDVFTYNGDAWHNWRIGKSYSMLNQNEKAFIHLNKAILVLRNWFIHKELADVCFRLNNMECSVIHIREAISKPDASRSLYYTIYLILKDSNPEMAEKHLELYHNHSDDLKREIEEYWSNR